MTRHSLRLRLLVAAAGVISCALIAAGLGLVFLFERNLERRYGAELDGYIDQIAGGLSLDSQGMISLDSKLADPRFNQVYGGLYWQAANEGTGQVLRSRSLWDVRLDLPTDEPPRGAVHVHEIAGPRGTMLLAHERRLVYGPEEREQFVRIVAAVDHSQIDVLRAGFARDLFWSLFLLAAVLVAGSWIQVTVGLRPLHSIRAGISAIRSGQQARLPAEMPNEVLPLVEEVNALLDAQAYAAKRAQDRAADLAHGFKTPLTALLGDVRRLRDRGEIEIAAEIECTAQMMRRHIDRELARSRVRSLRAPGASVRPIAEDLIRTLVRTPRGEEVRFANNCPENIEIAMEPDDLMEILGNLLENAARHAKSEVVVDAQQQGKLVTVSVDDNGSGVDDAPADRPISDRRLDMTLTGAGLGLIIVKDLLDLYGETLRLGRSELGGLRAAFARPAA